MLLQVFLNRLLLSLDLLSTPDTAAAAAATAAAAAAAEGPRESRLAVGASLSPLASLLVQLQQQQQQQQQQSGQGSSDKAAAAAAAGAAAAAEGAIDMRPLLPDGAAAKGFVGVYRQLARSSFVLLSPSLSLLRSLSPQLQLQRSSSSSSSSSTALLAAALRKVATGRAARSWSLGVVADMQQLIAYGLCCSATE
ncbi:hypothetical protein, conserved, partial [Eimeria tenella]